MGRFFGRRPDPTPAVRRALRRRFLDPGEEVLAGVHVQRPGTRMAQLSVGTSAGLGSAVASDSVTLPRGGRREWEAAEPRLEGIDPAAAARTIWATLALTTSRLLLVRNSWVTRRPRQVLASWRLGDIDRIVVPRGGRSLSIVRRGEEVRFELPLDHRFLPDVYRELPALFDRARAAAGAEPSGGPGRTGDDR